MHSYMTNPVCPAAAFALAWIVSLAALLQPLPGLAAGDDQQLLTAVETFLYQQLQRTGDVLDINVLPSAAQLPPCENPQPFLPSSRRQQWGRITVGVHCGTANRSARYLQAQVTATGDYVTLAAAVAAGTVITPALLAVARGDKSRLPPNAIFVAEEALGQRAKHQLAAGTIVQSQHLYREPLVQSAQKVVVELRGAGFAISREAEALEAGALGETIRVRMNRQQTLDTVVIGAGRVAPER